MGKGSEIRKEALEISKYQRHRGSDWSGVFQHENAVLVHERLAIVDVSSGAQPLIDVETGTALAVNGVTHYKILMTHLEELCRQCIMTDTRVSSFYLFEA